MGRWTWGTMVAVALGSSYLAGAASAAPPTPAPTAKVEHKVSGKEKLLREKVGLDDAKTKKVLALLDSQKAARKPAREAIKAAMGALKELVKANKADDAAFVAAVAKVQAAREKLHALELEQQAELGKVFTAKEHARWVVATRKVKKHDKADKADKADKHDAKAKPAGKDDDDDDDGAE